MKMNKKFKKILLGGAFAASTALFADNAAHESRFTDRLFFDVGAALHVPQTTASWIGGTGAVGFMFRDINVSLGGKYLTTQLAQSSPASGFLAGPRIEGKFNLIANQLTLVPSLMAAYGKFKPESSADNYSGYWAEFAVGALYHITNEVSVMPRPYYAFSRLTSGNNSVDISALGMDISVRFAFGQTHRLSY